MLLAGARPGVEVAAALPAQRNLDQWVCFWSIPVFYTAFGLIFVVLGGIMPPQSPTASAGEVVRYMARPGLGLGMALLALTLGLASLSSGVIVVQMRRMEGVSSALAYAYLAVLAIAGVPGCLLPGFTFALGAFRPEYDARIHVMLYDFGFLSFVGSLGCFIAQYLIFAIAIFLDRRAIFPRWLGYFTIWSLVTELVAIPVWVTRTGAFAWDGLLAFWLGTAIFVGWEFCLCVCLYRAIQSQTLEDVAPGGARG
jgi:hypothetical protein